MNPNEAPAVRPREAGRPGEVNTYPKRDQLILVHPDGHIEGPYLISHVTTHPDGTVEVRCSK